jgi:hypothetical protein
MLMKLAPLPTFSLVVLVSTPLLADAATLRVPENHPTIQAAIDAAVDGDVVRVAAGTYVENLIIQGKAISLIGAGARTTIVDGDGVDRVITVAQVATGNVTIAGFTIQDGQTSLAEGQLKGGGIFGTEASLIVRDNIITENRSCLGYGLAVETGTIRMLRNRIIHNRPEPDTDCSASPAIHLEIRGENYIERNVISDHEGIGADVHHNDAMLSLYIRHNVFRNNGSPIGGPGGLFAEGDLVVDHNLFANNVGSATGGASFVQIHESGGAIRNNSFVGNEAGFAGVSGMRIRVADDSNVTVINNLMSDSQPEEFPEIECENVPVVINSTNVFASGTNGQTAGTCTP